MPQVKCKFCGFEEASGPQMLMQKYFFVVQRDSRIEYFYDIFIEEDYSCRVCWENAKGSVNVQDYMRV